MNIHEYAVMHRVEQDHWWYRGLRGAFLPWLAKTQPRTVLDAGCGTGLNLQLLQQTGYDAQGVDASPEALEFCRARGLNRVQRGLIQSLPFEDQHFDLIYSFNVLDVLVPEDQQRALMDLRRCLAPGGTLILNVPAYQWLYSGHDVAVHTRTRFTRARLRSLLEASGFTVTFASYRVFVLFPLVATFKLLDRRAADATLDANARGHLGETSTWPNAILAAVMAFENFLMRLVPLPFGSSLFVVARKQ